MLLIVLQSGFRLLQIYEYNVNLRTILTCTIILPMGIIKERYIAPEVTVVNLETDTCIMQTSSFGLDDYPYGGEF